MMRASTAPQGGAVPRPLPARPRKFGALAANAAHVFTGLPALVRAGAAFLGLGLVLDAGYHLTHGITPHSHTPGAFDAAMVIHLIVVAGITLCMAGVVSAGIRSARSAHQRRQDR